jgi:hypothetical protein
LVTVVVLLLMLALVARAWLYPTAGERPELVASFCIPVV